MNFKVFGPYSTNGNALMNRRVSLNVSRQDLAITLGVKTDYIEAIECGRIDTRDGIDSFFNSGLFEIVNGREMCNE